MLQNCGACLVTIDLDELETLNIWKIKCRCRFQRALKFKNTWRQGSVLELCILNKDKP